MPKQPTASAEHFRPDMPEAPGPGRRHFLRRCALLLPLLSACATQYRPGSATTALPPHPRLLATQQDWQSLAERQRRDPDLAKWVAAILARARGDLAKPAVERRLEGRRLLGVSREFLRRSLFWAFAWRLTGERVFVERAQREMLVVAAFTDWNPAHFLDVAEMTTGLAIAYDWLYTELSPTARMTIRHALIDKGIAQARHGHKTFKSTHNWGQVCISGMVLGALAVAEDAPELAADLLAAAQRDAPIALAAYRPDGIYPEGPGYWVYGTSYEALLIAALRSALGDDWGLMAAPGLSESALFYAQSIGPTGRYFNFADCGEEDALPVALVYLARERRQPALLATQRERIRRNKGLTERFAPLSALWWPDTAGGHAPPLAYTGQGTQPLAIWRTAWDDAQALWFGIKGGGAHSNHGHMDAGSFVLDWGGVRWAKDLGMQDYHSLESRGIDLWNMKPGSPRWQVFRLGSAAHNTLTLDGQAHRATAMATLTMAEPRTARIDLSAVLGVPAQRTARFADNAVTLDDTVDAVPGRMVRWAMCTEAEIRIEGSMARLSLGGQQLLVQFSGTPVALSVLDISRPRRDFDHPNPNTRQLIAMAPVPADGQWRLSVRLTRTAQSDASAYS